MDDLGDASERRPYLFAVDQAWIEDHRTIGPGGAVMAGKGPVVTTVTTIDPLVARLSDLGLLLPPDVADFTGRAEAIDAIRAALAQTRMALVTGLSGVGKTTVAVRVAHLLHDELPDPPVFVDLTDRDGQPLDPSDVLADLLAAFGVPGRQIRASQREDLARWYQQELAKRRTVVVLDNAVADDQVLPLLPHAPNVVAIVTSQVQLGFLASRVQLGVLSQAEALAMLERVAGPSRVGHDPVAAHRLVELCGHLPLAIRIVGAQLREHPSRSIASRSIASLVRRLEDESSRLETLTARGMEVRSAFTRAYQALPADQARAFTLLGQLPPGEVTAPQLAPRLGTTNEHAGQLLDALVSSGLLEPSASPGSYRMHDLLRLYAKELSTEADRAQAHQP